MYFFWRKAPSSNTRKYSNIFSTKTENDHSCYWPLKFCNALIMFYRVQTWTAQMFWGRYISQIALKHHDYLVNFTEWRTIYTDRDPIALLHKSLIILIQQISESHAQSIKIGNLSFWRKVPKNIAKRATNVTTLSLMSK